MDYIRKNSRNKRKNTVEKTVINDRETKCNLEICLSDLKFDVSVEEDTYGNKELKEIKRLVRMLTKEIYIDRTYVAYKGNRFKDAFIVEERWDELCKIIYDNVLTKKKKCSKNISKYISDALMTVAIVYIYELIEKFGYDVDLICITPASDGYFSASYKLDTRTSWNF